MAFIVIPYGLIEQATTDAALAGRSGGEDGVKAVDARRLR